MRSDSGDRQGVAIVESLALALLVSVPVLAYLSSLLHEGVPRFTLAGDFALLEQAARRVWTGDSLLGPYSRFRWHHPGPLFFYLVAPFEATFSGSTGLFVGTCVINASAAGTAAALLRLYASRAHAIAGVAVLLAWFAAFGNVSPNPWNPLVVVLPLITFLVATALFARGESRAAIPAALFGMIALSNHVATAPTILIAGLAGTIGFVLAHRAGGLPRSSKHHLAIAGALVVLALVPPLIEQATAPRGNLRAVAQFFLNRESPLKPVSTGTRNLVLTTSWLPDRVLSGSLATESWVALGMRWDPVPEVVSTTARNIFCVHVLLIAIAGTVALRRRDWTSLSILTFGVLGEMVALNAMRAIVGDELHYLVFWTTAGSTVAWLGVLSTFFSVAAEHVRRLPGARPACILLGLLAGSAATSSQRAWRAQNQGIPGSYPLLRADLGPLHSMLVARLARDGSTPVIHLDGNFDLASAMLLELERDGIDVRVPEAERWMYSGVRSPDGVAPVIHLWFEAADRPYARARCLELVATRPPFAIYGSPTEETCAREDPSTP